MRIDVHAHYFPTDYVEKMQSLGRTDLHLGAGQGRSTDLSSRIATMDEARCDVQVLSAVGLDCQMHEQGAAVQAARYINDRYAATIEDNNRRFQAFGWLPLPYVDAAISEATRCFDELGFAGIAMSCAFQGRPLDDPEFEPLWEELDRRGAVVYVHPVGMHSCGDLGLDKFGLHLALGSSTQLAMAATRLVYSGVPQRNRKLRFIFAVCGGVLPYLLPRMERNLRRGFNDEAVKAVGGAFFAWVKQLPIDPADPLAEFRRFYYDTSIQDVPLALRAVKAVLGTEHVLLGSDEIFASLPEAVRVIEESDVLTDAEKEAILDRNAQELLQLAPLTTTTI